MGTLTFQATLGGSVNLLGPNTAATVNLTLPSADGTSGQALQTNGSGTLSFATLPVAGGGTGVTTSTGTGNNVLSNSPTLVTPALGTPASGVLTNTTGLPLTTGVTGTLPTANGGTNLTSFTANGVTYASSTSALATGSALTFDGTNFATTGTATAAKLIPTGSSATGNGLYLPAANSVGLSTNGTERMRIDSSGNLLVGTTSATIGGVSVALALDATTANTGYGLGINGNASNTQVARFAYAGTAVGSIVVSGSTTTYNVASDHRLKENIQDAESSSALIDALQVRQFDWKADNTHQRYGFIAQELVTLVPEAVYQPTDPKEMMAVDYSKLVPMLVKAHQEQQALITSLTARITALEAA